MVCRDCDLYEPALLKFQRQRSDISEHLETLRFIVVEFKCQFVLELGVRTGNSTVALLAGAWEIGGKVVSVDRDPCEQAKATIRELRLDKWWDFIQGDALAIPEANRPHLLFVDLDHTYHETVAVLELYAPLMASDGFVVFHDTESKPAVAQAIDEFLNDEPLNWRRYRWLNNSGLTVLRKMGGQA